MSGSAAHREVRVYRSSRRGEMYLFVDAGEDLDRVPQPLLEHFGRPVEALSLTLTRERRLARADAADVLAAIEADGYYLQMPPPEPGRST
ncbi:MAG: YcgL domain-containing protein [Pseudomonadota bacterium]